MRWVEFASRAPELAARGAATFERGGGEAFLATVADHEPPRVHPISLAVVGEGLYAFLLPSAKRRDLETDGRFALHGHVDRDAPVEFVVRGRASLVTDPAVRASVASGWAFQPSERDGLFEFSIEHAVLGVRETADDWPPRYSTWSEARAAGEVG